MNIVRPIFSALIPSHVVSQSQQTDCNDVLIKFADGSSALFPRIVLNVLEYFREADGKAAFEVKECDLPAFKVYTIRLKNWFNEIIYSFRRDVLFVPVCVPASYYP